MVSQSKSRVSPGSGGDDEELVLGQPGHGQVGLDAAALVEPLGVDHLADGRGHVIGADVLKHLFGVRSLNHELGHGGQVVDAHVLAHGHVLGG